MINLSLLNPLILGTSVLEPDFDLSFRQIQSLSQLKSSRSGDVLVSLVLKFESESLIGSESRSLTTLSSVFASTARH